MTQGIASRRPIGGLLACAAVVLAGAIGALAITALSGTKTGLVLGIAAIGGPAAIYLAIVAPLIFPFGLYVMLVPFDNILDFSSLGTVTKLLAIVSGAAIVLYLARTRQVVKPPRSLMLWAALYVWAAITAFWAMDQKSVFQELPTAVELLLLYAAISILPADRASVRWVAFATVAGGVLAAAYGAYLFHNGVDLYYGGRLRITTDTGAIDPNHFAAALLLPIALCVTNLLYTRTVAAAAVNLGALGMLFIGLTLSQSRGGVLAIGTMLLYLLVRCTRRLRLIVLMAATAIVALAFASQTAMWSRFGEAMSTGGAGRTSIWRVGLVALKSHWLFGAGYNNFPFAYDRAFLQTPHQIAAVSSWHRAPHDLLIGTSVELGIVGLVLLLAAWVGQFRLLEKIPPAAEEFPLRLALEATVIGIFVAALFLDVMTVKYLWLTFILMALVRNAYLRRTRWRPNYA